MANGVVAQVEGVVVAHDENEYNFKDRETGEVIEGVTRKLWIVSAFDAPPSEVKFHENDLAEFVEAVEHGERARVRMSIMIGAKGATYRSGLVVEPALPFPDLDDASL